MKKTLPLIALLLCAVIVGVLVGNMEQNRKIAAHEELLKTMTPKACIYAYVDAIVRQDEAFLRALNKQKENIAFDFSPKMTLPEGVVEISENAERERRSPDKNGYDYAAFDTLLEFRDKNGDLFEASYAFVFEKETEDSPWQLVNYGF